MYRGQPVVVENIETDPLWADYRCLALAHGLRACWSTPIMNAQGNVSGSFALYFREPRSPEKQHTELIKTATHTASALLCSSN
jgi:GAF domain-containing protein